MKTTFSNCNRCNRGKGCKGDFKFTSRDCSKWEDVDDKFPLVELALAYPQELYNTLVNLPFKVNLILYFS